MKVRTPDPLLTATKWIWSDQDSIKRWNRTAYFVDKTLAFLRDRKDKPCYINLWTDDVHTPWIAGDDETGRHPGKPQDEKNFKFVLKEFDKQVGRLMEGLKELGIDENTLVIFTSDNGPLPNFRQDRSAGLRGSKLSLYEGGIRLPFIARWPQKIEAKRVDSLSVLSALDILPSFLSLAGVKSKAVEKLDGEDRSDAWLGKQRDRKKILIWEYGGNDTLFNVPKAANQSPALALREGKWKFLMNTDGSRVELYDLQQDKSESINLASRHPTMVRKFSARLMKWWESLPPFEKEK